MIFKVDNLGFSYNKNKQLFSNVSFSLSDGDILSIMGVNGIGKTSFIKCFLQINKGYQGSIYVDEKNLAKVSLHDRASIIGYAMLNDYVGGELKVSDYICLGIVAQLDYFSSPTIEQYQVAYDLCKKYNLHHLFKRKISTLSQGESQLITIMRVLMQNPQIIVFDEPTSTLDLKNQKQLLELIKELSNEGKIIIQITHNPNHALMLGGKVLLMKERECIFGDISILHNMELMSSVYGLPLHIVKDRTQEILAFEL